MLFRTFCLIAMTLASLAAQAGAVLKTKVHDIAQNKDSATLLYAQDGNLRVETGDPQKSYAVFSNDALYSINPKDKTYTTLDRAAIGKMADQLNPALKQLQEQMAKMSPEQADRCAVAQAACGETGGELRQTRRHSGAGADVQ